MEWLKIAAKNRMSLWETMTVAMPLVILLTEQSPFGSE